MNTQQLKELALRATPGPWYRSSAVFNGITCSSKPFALLTDPLIASASEKRNAEFIASANPATITILIERLESAERERDELKRNQELNLKIKQAMHERFTRAEAELARRDAAAGEPATFEWKVHYPGIGKSGPWVKLNDQRAYEKLKLKHSGDADYEFRELYTDAPPAEVSDDALRQLIRIWQSAAFPSAELYDAMREVLGAMREVLGAQPQKVVELPALFNLKMAGDVKTKQYFKGSNDTIKQIAGLLDAANIPYEVKK